MNNENEKLLAVSCEIWNKNCYFSFWQLTIYSKLFPTPMNQMPPLFCPLYSSQQSTFRFTFSCAELFQNQILLKFLMYNKLFVSSKWGRRNISGNEVFSTWFVLWKYFVDDDCFIFVPPMLPMTSKKSALRFTSVA